MTGQNPETKHIFLSAHLDDAVFSCGGLIAKTASSGCPVEVVTFFAGLKDPDVLPPQQQKAIESITYEERK